MRYSRSTAAVTAFATAASTAAMMLASTNANAATSANLVANPSFTAGKAGWAGSDNTVFKVASNGYNSSAGANLVPVAAGNVRLTDSPNTVSYTTAGATYTATARVKNPRVGTTINGALALVEQAPDAATPLSERTAFTLADTRWRTVTVSGIAAGNVTGAAGAHGLSLNVLGRGLSTTQKLLVDDVTVTRTTPNDVPTPAFNATTSYLTAEFDGSATTDADGSITSYRWDYGDGTTGTGQLSSHTYTSAGTKTVTLTVKDDQGATRSMSKPVQVVANLAPTASFTSTANYLKVSLDASTSADSDGTITSYAWNFGDGTSAAGQTATHTYAQAGSYVVSLIVTDNAGAQTKVTRTVTAVAQDTGVEDPQRPLWGMYNGEYGEDEMRTMFGGTSSTPLADRKYVEITSQYYQYGELPWSRDFKTPTFPNFKLDREKAQADKGIAKIMTFAAHSSSVVPAIAAGRAADPARYDWAVSVVDAWIARSKQVYDYDPNRRLWVGMNSEPDVGFQQGTYPFTPAEHGKFFSFFYNRVHQKAPGMKTYLHLGGYQVAWINTMFTNMTVAPDLIAVDPYANATGNQTAVNLFNSDLNKFRLSTGAWRTQYLRLSNLPRVGVPANSGIPIPLGISEHGVDTQDHTDAEIAAYIRQGREAMDTTNVEFAIWFNSDSGPQGNHKLTPATNPLAAAAFRDELWEPPTN